MKLLYRPIDVWPGDLTTHRTVSPFSGDWRSTLEVLEREVYALTGTSKHFHVTVVVQLAVPEGAIRQDGQLRSGTKGLEHPGVILNIDGKDGPLRFACDKFDSRWKSSSADAWRHNLRAIALGLEALRKVQRYGLGTGTEQYVGFQALPPATPMPAAAMTFDRACDLLGDATGAPLAAGHLHVGSLDPHDAWRTAAKTHHPDAGGDPDMFRRITEARDVIAATWEDGYTVGDSGLIRRVAS